MFIHTIKSRRPIHFLILIHEYKQTNKQTMTCMGGSPGDVTENPVTLEKQKKGWRMSCDVGEATEGLENEL